MNLNNLKFFDQYCDSNFVHSESIILAEVTDEDEYNRKFPCENLIEARMNLPLNFIRVFDKSVIKLNLSAFS